MSKPWPKPGTHYTLLKRDSARGFWGVAEKAYGNSKEWKKIYKANLDSSKTRWLINPKTMLLEANTYWLIGTVIWIPGSKLDELKEQIREDVTDLYPMDALDKLRIMVKGVELEAIEGATIMRSIDHATDGWTAVVPWNPENEIHQELFRPFAYHPAEVYLGGELIVRGTLYVVAPKLDPMGRTLKLEGWSLTADIVDSTMPPPYEANKITLEQRARDLVLPLGIDVVSELKEDEQFDRVTADKTDSIFDHLITLAKQRAALVTSTAQGAVLLTQAASGSPVATLIEDFPPFMDLTATFNGRERFFEYKVTSSTPKKNKTNTSTDSAVPRSRKRTFTANEGNAEDLAKTSDWERSKAMADALTIPFPVWGWRNPENGDLWEENTIVTVISPTLFVPNGYDFLIRSVEYMKESRGDTAVLGLVPPQVYTGEPIEDIWVEQ